MGTAQFIEWIIKSVVIFLAGAGGFAYLTLMERRVLARIQTRIGPNRAGPAGLLQPIADGIKLIFKEELIPDQVDKVMFVLAPIVTVFPAIVIWAVIPWGTSITMFGYEVKLYLADVDAGVLYLTAVASVAVYGIVLAGWASNNKYALLGGLRSSAQMISYEIALGLSLVVPIMLAGSMSLVKIVEAQSDWWFAIKNPIAFIIFLIAALAEVNRAPFDMPEAEQELVAGYHSEYSGMKFALFFMAEYIKMIAVSAIAASIFLGGYKLPLIELPPLLGPLVMFVKILVLLFGMIWVRATLPRFRYDRLMAFGWKVLLPLALFSVFITAVVMVV
ncbi:MAG TPA: NADH-quinone oxidoreductase subunit NuoH [Anaerolineales bacterium]|nr:NADH-quinone oxidoreductase subunit NuoH [Anaerolineales bacterium]